MSVFCCALQMFLPLICPVQVPPEGAATYSATAAWEEDTCQAAEKVKATCLDPPLSQG